MGLYVQDFSLRQFKKLERLQLSDLVTTTESKQYIYTENKGNLKNQKKLIKIYYRDTPSNMSDKAQIVSKILENKEYLDIPELVLPESLVSINGEIKGIKMPLVETNINMIFLLNNPNVKLEIKLKYLKEILTLIQKVMNIYELKDEFFLGDIQESNFILDALTQQVKAIDLDSSYFTGTTPFPARYLASNKAIDTFDKKFPRDSKTDLHIPSRETTYLEFAYMLLNVLSNYTSHRFTCDEYYKYLAYLNSLGFDKKLIYFFESLYSMEQTIDIEPEDIDRINCNKDYTYYK